MNNVLKIAVYAVLIASVLYFGIRFYQNYSGSSLARELPELDEERPAPGPVPGEKPAAAGDPPAEAPATNAAPPVTPSAATPDSSAATASESPPRRGGFMGYLAGFLGVLVLLGLLVAYDVTNYIGNRTVKMLFNDEGEGLKNPEYEEAEHAWANNRPLEAIQMMRDYLKKYPREQHVALRIAEIYEKDLKNDLAAALEYEEVLKHKLPPERWGWAAIHLCNIYTKMNQTDKAVALLRRVEAEYGETAAARKARARLSMFDSIGAEALDPRTPEEMLAPPPASKPAAAAEPPSNLPPGFRPKKG